MVGAAEGRIGAVFTYAEAPEGWLMCIRAAQSCSPSAAGYIASAKPVTQMHWMPATSPPDRYRDRTSARPADDGFAHTSERLGRLASLPRSLASLPMLLSCQEARIRNIVDSPTLSLLDKDVLTKTR